MKLFSRKFGSGLPMIILHGLYGSSDNWLSIARKMADNFKVYLVDLRNHGKSPHDELHNYEVMREDLLEFMNDEGLDKAILAGHSMGGKVVMCFARHYPERVSRLIVIDIAPKTYSEISRKETQGHFAIMKAMNDVDLQTASSRGEIEEILSESIISERIRKFLMKNLRQDENSKYFWSLNLGVLLKELDNIMDGENEKCFDRKTPVTGFPALFIRGEKSPYITDGDMNTIEKIFPDARLVTISDAGHWLHAEQPGLLIRAVEEFTGVRSQS
jgi:esterase